MLILIFYKKLQKKKYTFISTGMSTEEDIDNAVNIFKTNNCSFELMHCVSTYPMDPSLANLETINALKKNIIVLLDTVGMKME